MNKKFKYYYNNFYSAFTLAEVLITLGIIGVVTAMTIPVLINNISEKSAVPLVIKYQSIFQSAIKQYMSDNNYNNLVDSDIFNNGGTCSQAGTQRIWNALKSYFSVSKDCNTNINQGCTSSGTKYLNNTSLPYAGDANSDSDSLYAKAVLNDGIETILVDEPNNCSYDRSISHSSKLTTVCGRLRIITNDQKGPNKIGRDEFYYWILASGEVVPAGTIDDHFYGCNPLSNDTTPDVNGAPGAGIGCTYQILIDHTMNY